MSIYDVDSHKLGYHPERVSRWKEGYSIVMPLHAEIGITSRCNHHCKFCTLDWITHGSEELASPIIGKLVIDMKALGVKSVYLAGEGEPTLHPDFTTIVEVINKSGMSVSVSTNGARFFPKVSLSTLRYLSWIRFSVDTIDCETYEAVHGVREGQLRDVKNNIANAVMIKHEQGLDTDIGVQVVLTEDTAKYLVDTVAFFRMLGVDNVQIKPCHNHPSSKHQTRMDAGLYKHLQGEVEKYNTKDFKVIFRSKGMERLTSPRNWSRCHGFDFYVLISANGDVLPCNVFYNKPGFIYGNIYNETFYDIWVGKRRRDIIKDIEASCFSNCGDYRCRLDVINRYLHRVLIPERNDEFI